LGKTITSFVDFLSITAFAISYFDHYNLVISFPIIT